jgi:GMP synthase-like glutamine amidotransferase
VALAGSPACRYQAMRRVGEPVWAVQFHPERADAANPAGVRVLRNFFAELGPGP